MFQVWRVFDLPRKPKLSFSHKQGQSEFFFKNAAGRLVSMIDLWGRKGVGQKTKEGTWSLTRPLQWRKK